MSTSNVYPEPSWSWANLPEQEDTGNENTPLPNGIKDEEDVEPQFRATPKDEHPELNQDPPRQQKYYPPRTCRICLEEVLPTFEPMHEGVTSMFNPAPKVSYVSSDPESGRLIRPCKCRGSQAYVHEGCLQEWRHADPSYGRRTFWECPTCKFQYRLERMKWSRWLTSTTLQIVITVVIMLLTVFVFGFIADPIINLYLDPYDTITSTATGGTMPAIHIEDEDDSWTEHFVKGLASLGLLGFVKVFFAMSPWHWWNLRQSGFLGGARRAGTGRDRMENISWTVVVIGVVTFLYGVWRWVRAWTRRTLEKAGERVADVQGDDDGEEDERNAQPNAQGSATQRAEAAESRKDQ